MAGPLILYLAVGGLSVGQIKATPLQPMQLRVEDWPNPIGIGDTTPEFSWIFRDSEPNQGQSGFQIRVASSRRLLERDLGDLWDSGKVASDSVAYHGYAGRPLSSRQICYWKVRTWNRSGEAGEWSEIGSFELGLLANQDWDSFWIWRHSSEPDDYTYFRREVVLPEGTITRARAYLSASHRFEFYVNQREVGKGPNFAYPEYQFYRTVPLEEFLTPGKANVFGLLCHWYGPGQGRPASSRGLILKVTVDYADGRSWVLRSDGEWKVRRAEWHSGKPSDFEPALGLHYRNREGVPAEWIDGREHPVGWLLPGYSESGWEKAVEIGQHPVEPWSGTMRAQETTLDEYEVKPVAILRIGERRYVADFGKVYSGIPKIVFRQGVPGTRLYITLGYRLWSDGAVVRFAQNTDMSFQYTLRGGEEIFRPYWYLGFRYLEVDNCQVALDSLPVTLVVRHNKVEWQESEFESSSPVLNGIWELVKRSVMLGSQEQFVDTPTREQAQFTYDAYQTSLAAMKCFGERDLTQQGLRDFAQSQQKFHQSTGKVNCVYPNGDGARDIPDWTQSWIFWAWDYFFETGDRELISEIFDQLVRTGEWIKSTENPKTGLVDLGDAVGYSSGIVDWPDRYGYDRKTTQRTVLSLNAYLDYRCLARLALEMKRRDVAARFESYVEQVAEAIQRQLWDERQEAYIDGLYADGAASAHASQQANMMVIALGLAKGERLAGALRAVKRAGHSSSPMLVRFLVQAYGDADQDRELYDYLTIPGRNWAHILKDGGTFTYESWNGRYARLENSESHPVGALGAVIALQQYVLGVKPLAAQFSRIEIRPHPGPLEYARGWIPTQRGRISVAWRREEDSFRMNVSIPANVQAQVQVPAGRAKQVTHNGRIRQTRRVAEYFVIDNVGSGEHEFVANNLAPQ